jgi:RHS repeat-associated protein
MNGSKITHIRKGANNATGPDAIQMHFFYDAQGRPAIVQYNGEDYAYLHNVQGDITGIVDMDGAIVVQYAYDAWGRPIVIEGSMAGTLGEDNPFRYRGYVWDGETGLYYLRSRYYDPVWGRWLNADNTAVAVKLGARAIRGLNLYAYCFNNPVNMADKAGRWPQWITDSANWVAGAANDAWNWTAQAAIDTGDWTVQAAIDAGDWTAQAAIDTGDWTVQAAIDTGGWTVQAAVDVGNWTAQASIDTWNWTKQAATDVHKWITKTTVGQIAWDLAWGA